MVMFVHETIRIIKMCHWKFCEVLLSQFPPLSLQYEGILWPPCICQINQCLINTHELRLEVHHGKEEDK